MRVTVTRIEWDGTMQRRMVDTAQRDDGPQWEDLATRALAVLPPYTPLPQTPIYHVSVDDQVILAAEHDLTGPQLDLVTAVLAMGEVVLARSPGSAKHSYAVAERSRSTAAGARRSADLGGRDGADAHALSLTDQAFLRGGLLQVTDCRPGSATSPPHPVASAGGVTARVWSRRRGLGRFRSPEAGSAPR